MEKDLGYLGRIILPSYVGIRWDESMNHEIRISVLNNVTEATLAGAKWEIEDPKTLRVRANGAWWIYIP